jgi:lysophospholipase L1-like esterase
MSTFPGMMAQGKYFESDKKEETGKGMVFLFQGDSITDGNRGRNTDPNHIMGHGYAFSIASRLGADFPEKRLEFYNRGISGDKVTDLAARWQKDTLDLNPDVLSILVGVNDAGRRIKDGVPTIEQYKESYQSILERTRTHNPEVLLVLCQPFILPVGHVKDNWEVWYDEITKEQAIVKNLAKTYNAVYVEFQKVLDKACLRALPNYWIWDGVHPTVAGHELLTREWIRMVSKRLPFIR